MTTDDRHRDMLRKELTSQGFNDWSFGRVDNDDNENVMVELGRWRALENLEGVSVGEAGDLHAEVVGSQSYDNERVAYFFTPDGYDLGEEASPFDDIEPMG